MAASLMEELLEEVLLRIPPDDPASLARAALVSKRWCRLICGGGFRRRFREFHGNKPPLLGFVCQCQSDLTAQAEDRFFVPTSSFKPPRRHGDRRRNLTALQSCHGRVLLHSARTWANSDALEDLFVWDPITDKLRKLPRWPLRLKVWYSDPDRNWDAAVLCAAALGGNGGCDHLDCHHGHFMVVLVGIEDHAETFISVYSSEADRWSEPIYSGQRYDYIETGNCILIGNAIYFKCLTMNFTMNRKEPAILKYDLLAREISTIRIPRVGVLEHIKHDYIVLMATEDGGLGFAGMPNLSTLSLWSRMDHGSAEGARWVQSRVIELVDIMLPTTEFRMEDAYVAAFADAGTGGGVVFIWSNGGLYSLHLKSGSCSKMLGEYGPMDYVVAYFSFCTPAPGAVSIDEGPGACEPSA